MSAVTIEHVSVAGWDAAIRGMRNARESWDKIDSDFDALHDHEILGPNDLDLCTRLIRAGSSDRKFLRMLTVTADITAPRYWWVDFDTYKVATVKNSCSTMNKLGSRDLTDADFADGNVLPAVLTELNRLGAEYRASKRPRALLRRLKQHLPEGFLIKATWHANYEVLLSIYKDRRNHRLSEFQEFCAWIETLPHMPAFLAAASGVRGDK